MLTKEKIVDILRRELPYLRERYGVEKIAIFDSFAKGLQRKGSDVDILVELKKPLGLDFVDLAYYLEEVLNKVKVDVATFDCLKSSYKNPRYEHIAEDIEQNLIYV
ncbi:MAG TPA: nucleotidyltransferase family protein [Candidatus Tripitaka californicus]|uniref:nucleotidyltransferase family protein n=1 Tax=Candidatus Tripitaka californicus TaxID=3367616 RepID=UPI0040263F6A|nr:nucleotidyltransferase domain-containing protein [Planctomycetota bacterium]